MARQRELSREHGRGPTKTRTTSNTHVQVVLGRRFALTSAWAKKNKALVQIVALVGTIISVGFTAFKLWIELF